jgi:AraC-like DNA-binding protein
VDSAISDRIGSFQRLVANGRTTIGKQDVSSSEFPLWRSFCLATELLKSPLLFSESDIVLAQLHEGLEMDRRVHATIEIMRKNSRRGLSVADLARTVNLSSWHFSHLFKASTSKSPKHYLKEVRMQQAEEMFRATSLSLKEVVSAIGLSERSHFSREFKRLHGLTPK